MSQHKDWNPTEYTKESDMQLRQAMEILERVTFKTNDNVLDVGCGDGKITAMIAGHVCDGAVKGIDLSPEMINYATKQFHTISQLSFDVCNADNIHYQSEFDYIFSFSCLHWVSNQKKVWQGFHRALKKNGTVMVGFQVDHEHFWDTIKQHMLKQKWRDYFQDFVDPYNHFTQQDIRKHIEAAHFYIKRFEEIYHVENFGNIERLSRFFISWVPQIRILPESLRHQFTQEVLHDYQRKIEDKMRQEAGVRIKRYIIEASKA